MSELVPNVNSQISNEVTQISAAARFAKLNNSRTYSESSGVNPYYHHLQCKVSNKGYFDIYQPIQPTEENKENRKEVLNPEVISNHRIIGLDGDVIETRFGFGLSINKANDIVEGENPYIRCQTFKLETVDSTNQVLDTVWGNKPLPTPVFSPKKSNKDSRVPNLDLTQVSEDGISFKLYGQVDPKYAERVGIPSVRTCVSCVMDGTNVFIDKQLSPDKPPSSYECKLTGELIFLLRRVAYKKANPDNPMQTTIEWVDITELNVEALNKPVVVVIPLTKTDMFNKIGSGPYDVQVNLDKLGQSKNLQLLGKTFNLIKTKVKPKDYDHYLEGIDLKVPVLYTVPLRLMLGKLTIPIGQKESILLSEIHPDQEVLEEGRTRAIHAWYVYQYEKGMVNKTLLPGTEYPVYSPNIYEQSKSVTKSQKSLVIKESEDIEDSKDIESVDVKDSEFLVDKEGNSFWDRVRLSQRNIDQNIM
jgi:hypothetical protein